jgi:hypothetical protein
MLWYAWDPEDPYNPTRLIDDSGATEYTLAQLKAYVAACCSEDCDTWYGAFISSDEYAGSSSEPSYLPSDYADGSTSVEELCALVSAMTVTRRKGYFGYATGAKVGNAVTGIIAPPPEYSGVEASAETAFDASSLEGSGYAGIYSTLMLYVRTADGVESGANLQFSPSKAQTYENLLSTEIYHDVSFYAIMTAMSSTVGDWESAEWDDFGTGMVEDAWNFMGQSVASLSGTAIAEYGPWSLPESFPAWPTIIPTYPTPPDMFIRHYTSRGMQAKVGDWVMCLIHWSF